MQMISAWFLLNRKKLPKGATAAVTTVVDTTAEDTMEGIMAGITADITDIMGTMDITMDIGMATVGMDMDGAGTAIGMRSIIGALATPGAIGTGMGEA